MNLGFRAKVDEILETKFEIELFSIGSWEQILERVIEGLAIESEIEKRGSTRSNK
jgi:hypothetical protein